MVCSKGGAGSSCKVARVGGGGGGGADAGGFVLGSHCGLEAGLTDHGWFSTDSYYFPFALKSPEPGAFLGPTFAAAHTDQGANTHHKTLYTFFSYWCGVHAETGQGRDFRVISSSISSSSAFPFSRIVAMACVPDLLLDSSTHLTAAAPARGDRDPLHGSFCLGPLTSPRVRRSCCAAAQAPQAAGTDLLRTLPCSCTHPGERCCCTNNSLCTAQRGKP